MPILVALVEGMADPRYGVAHSGNTPGAETLIILNGPLIKELGFNYEQGALRDGIQANTAIGRFWRLYLRRPSLAAPASTPDITLIVAGADLPIPQHAYCPSWGHPPCRVTREIAPGRWGPGVSYWRPAMMAQTAIALLTLVQ